MKLRILLLALSSITTFAFAQQQPSRLERYLLDKDMVNVQTLDSTLRVDLKYATTDNFTKVVLYDSLTNAYLHRKAANMLVKAQKYLRQLHPGYSLLVYDAARPLSVQKKMYRVVQGTAQAAYVANPANTGLHNYGMAVDLTIVDENGTPLDMGTPFDFFGRAAGINREEELIAEGRLTRKQVSNRILLRKVMVYGGFQTIRGEWWHFNAVSRSVARQNYVLLD